MDDERKKIGRIRASVRKLLRLFEEWRIQFQTQHARPIEKKAKKFTKETANETIRTYLTDHRDLYEAAKAGKPGALKTAGEVFGRNAISKATTISQGMISKLPVWHTIAEQLGLRHGTQRASSARRLKKIGLCLAENARRTSEDAADEEVNPEIEPELRDALDGAVDDEERADLEKQLRDRPPREMREILDLTRKQRADERSRRCPSAP